MNTLKSWCPEIEENTQQQINNLMEHPGILPHIAVMPDAHFGYGMPIGTVIQTTDIIIPNAVGVDIGCGMSYVEFQQSATEISKADIKQIIACIKRSIPVGFSKHKEPYEKTSLPDGVFTNVISDQIENALFQLGTLGGGNHFIELQKTHDDKLALMVHSGSRNLGYTTAKHYNEKAKELNKKWYHKKSADHDLAFLPLEYPLAQEYIIDMKYCIKFAEANRQEMIRLATQSLSKMFDVKPTMKISCCHNFAVQEHHNGSNVWVHRKGATRARLGDLVVIPGSQGTCSYVGKGRGNLQSINSCSHGAGRKLGRNLARKYLDLDKEKDILNSQGIVHDLKKEKHLDEAPSAYKDINMVMEQQKDLVDIVTKLTPLGNIKG